MRHVFLMVACFLSISAVAQQIEKFFDYNWKECEVSAARFYSEIKKTDSGWHRDDYFVHDNVLQMDGTYEDEACNIPNGLFFYFYSNKKVQYTGKYVHGKKEGVWLSFHPNGAMADSSYFVHDEITGVHLSWYDNGFPSDSVNFNPDGSGIGFTWFDDGTPSSAGRYAAGKKMTGKWQFFYKSGKISSLETYNNGALINKEYYDEAANKMTDTSKGNSNAEFPGAENGWLKYLQKHLYFPPQYQITNADKAVDVITFTVNEDGSISNVFVYTPFYPEFDNIAVNVITRSPKWKPAINHNRPVKSQFKQAVTFSQE